MLERAREAELLTGGEIIVADKGISGEFEDLVASFDAALIRPDRKDEKPRFGELGGVRQWIESVYNTAKSQLSLEDHGGRIPEGVWARICQRVLALAAGVWHSWQLWGAGIIDAPAAPRVSDEGSCQMGRNVFIALVTAEFVLVSGSAFAASRWIITSKNRSNRASAPRLRGNLAYCQLLAARGIGCTYRSPSPGCWERAYPESAVGQ